MIDLTVKTLDSQNHAFSLNDDITVRQFKEHIADTVNISVDLQRLIYCGRVLQDEKLLSEYDVNGKVIHLVQRAPPSSTQRNHNTTHNTTTPPGDREEWRGLFRPNARQRQQLLDQTYFSSIPILTDIIEGNQFRRRNFGNSLVNSHSTVIRRMLDQANSVIDRLDNPSAPSSSSASADNNSSSSNQPEQMQSTTACASESGSSETIYITTDMDVPPSGTDNSDNETFSTEMPEANVESTQEQIDGTASQSSAPTSLVPQELAELLDMLLTTQDRLRPYIRERLLSNNDIETRQLNHVENQRIIDGVTECFHFLSHAQHALSSLHVDMQHPQTLRCRHLIMPPSALLQAGVPIQVEAHISLHGQNDHNPDGDDDGDNTPRPPTGSTTNTGNDTPASTGTNPQTQFIEQSVPVPSPLPPELQSHLQTALGTVFNFPNNVEVVMESAPQAARGWTFTTSDNQASSNNNNNNVTNNNNGSSVGGVTVAGGIFPWAAALSPDMVRHFTQTVAGYMAQAVGNATASPTITTATATTTSTPSSTPSMNATSMGCPRHCTPGANNESTTTSGQNSQTRGNTETHPTTSTQTRTTARTHVFHQNPQALGVGIGLADFDPLLPCNSLRFRRGNLTSSSASASTTSAAPTSHATASTPNNTQNNAPTDTQAPSQACNAPTMRRVRREIFRDIVDFSNTTLAVGLEGIDAITSDSADGISLSDVFTYRGRNLAATFLRKNSELTRAIFTTLGNISVQTWFQFVRGDFTHLNEELIQTLRTQIRNKTGETPLSDLPGVISKILCSDFMALLSRALMGEPTRNENGRIININATVNKILEEFFINLSKAIFDPEINTANIVQIIRDFGRYLSEVLRYCFVNGQSGLDRVIVRFARQIAAGTHRRFREWMFETVIDWVCNYTRQVPQLGCLQILEFIVYKIDGIDVATTSSETADDISDSATEPMEVDTEPNSHPSSDNSWVYEDDMPTATFPGHENLLPDWIPIVARDGVTQRRQLSLSEDDVTTMSDAYLATMPSKRRKLVEQRKAPLLISPTSNHSTIPSSMERLIRESVGRAGFQEVDGAVAAIVADPTVRRAFGQAVRESLNPRRYQTPDFPDPLRFPNATKFFTNPNRPAKQ